MRMNPMLWTDFYKVGHIEQYPENTSLVYSNLTPRKSRIPNVNYMVQFGLQAFIKEYLIKRFNEDFFQQKREKVVDGYKRIIKASLKADLPSYKHVGELHEIGYLPLRIKAIPEGDLVPMRVPSITIVNTEDKFYWLTNFIETIMSCLIWQPSTSATIALEYKKTLLQWARRTGMPEEFVQFQGHDFSFRGMSSLETAMASAAGHALAFNGSDTIPAICYLEEYYNANCENEFIIGSVNATEHSVMCAGGDLTEIETFERLITKVYPKGIVSIVSDTWNLWRVLTEYAVILRDKILARDGKVVFRPDSGDPADIICGTEYDLEAARRWPYGKSGAKEGDCIGVCNTWIVKRGDEWELHPQHKGVVELLWDTFGGTVNNKGFKVLDPHVGAIYGDSITLARAEDISSRLAYKGFASQVVLGIGSYTYQYNTRDTFGMAIKATYAEVKEGYQTDLTDTGGPYINTRRTIGKELFKDPITDDGTKKSAKGLLRVEKEDGEYVLYDQQSWEEEAQGELYSVFLNGSLLVDHSLADIRNRLNNNLYVQLSKEKEKAGERVG